METIFVDSNIWCYYFDRSAKEHEAVSREVERALKERVVINTVILIEVAHYLIKNLGPLEGKRKMDIFNSYPMEIVNFDYKLAKKSIEELAKYSHVGIGGRDATILASMAENNIKKIMTHDQAFKQIDFIEILDPVKNE
ncbi:MAG: type II toxin-antitoxin system VapC family toxin [Candidatus Freyarchaeum deiterrae]